LVCSRNGQATLGSVWVIKNVQRFVKNSIGQPDFFSLVLFTLVYATLLVLFLYLLNKKIKHGPVDYEKDEFEEGTRSENPLLSQ